MMATTRACLGGGGMSDQEMWSLPNGQVLVNVHPETACEGRGCPIHHPSDHHMKDWPLNWRNDRGIMERTCVHEVHHPDPDDLWYRRNLTFHSAADEVRWGLHGCCPELCCRAEEAA